MAAADDLTLLEEVGAAAGAIALDYFRRDPKVWWKEGNSPVSEADYAVDAFLKDKLVGARRSYGWVSEEMRRGSASTHAARRFFVVDPIDGTRSYLRGERTWCVSIAVVAAGRPIAAAVVAPAMGHTFTAHVDGPTLFNGEPCRMATRGEEETLRVAVPEAMRRRIDRAAAGRFTVERAVPTLAYRLALVAGGHLDGTLIRSRANDWDIAAADLLLERAGGRLCDAAGEGVLYTSQGKRHGLLMAAASGSIERVRALAEAVGERA